MASEGLVEGLTGEFSYTVPESKTVPRLYDEAEELQVMPQVFATAFLIGLIEWTCVRIIKPFIDWPEMQSVGTQVNISHLAPTLPGMTVTVTVTLVKVEKRRLEFEVVAHDELAKICEGTHGRALVAKERFDSNLTAMSTALAER